MGVLMAFGLASMGLLAGCAKDGAPSNQAPQPSDPRAPVFAPGEAQKDAAAFLSVSAAQKLEESGSSVMRIDVQSYALKGQFDWETERLAAEVEVALKVLTDAGSVLVLDSRVDEVVSIELAEPSEDRTLPFQVDEDNGALVIDKLDLPTDRQQAGSELTLRIRYFAAANGQSTLHAVLAREADPIQARVVYTTSEPLSASTWMPCNNTPADRALFSVELSMPKQERLVANGRLLSDTIDDLSSLRTMAYATDNSLPTYLMAFAAGEFQVTEILHEGLPVSVWARRGLPHDGTALVEMLAEQIDQISELLIPYPFEKYALVLLPRFPAGGLEHASVTFQAETRSTEVRNDGDYTLAAHELAHQWFGDYVTVRTWDDLWIKEGMATLLASQLRHDRDQGDPSDILPGRFLRFSDGMAIRDRDLEAGAKYTSGPYGRAAWFFNQLRALVGETVFWNTMKALLVDRAWGTVGTDDVLRAFSKHLTTAELGRASRAIDAKATPRFEAGEMAYRLVDEDSSLVVSLDWRLLALDGSVQSVQLRAGSALPREAIEKGGILALFDPQGVHPLLSTFGYESPASPTARERISLTEFEKVSAFGSAAAREALEGKVALDWAGWTDETLDEAFQSLDESLSRTNSWRVRAKMAALMCQDLSFFEDAKSRRSPVADRVRERAWSVLGETAPIGRPSDWALDACLTKARLQEDLSVLKGLVSTRNSTISQTEDLALSLAGQAEARPLWLALLESGPSLRARQTALEALGRDMRRDLANEALAGGGPARGFWDKAIQVVGPAGRTQETFSEAFDLIRLYVSVDDEAARSSIPAFAAMVSDPLLPKGERSDRLARGSLCDVRESYGSELWPALLEALKDGAYAHVAKALLDDPALCDPAE